MTNIAVPTVFDPISLAAPVTLVTDQLTNLLVNGGFEVWQRGTTFPAMATNAFGPDRWQFQRGGASAMTISQESTIVDAGSRFSAKCVHTLSGVGSIVFQALEDRPQLAGQTLSMSVRVRTATPGAVRVYLQDSTGVGPVSGYHSGGGTFETLTATKTIGAAPTFLYLVLAFDASATAYLDNAMLVIGPTPASYLPLHPAQELTRCQRYYEVWAGDASGGVMNMSQYTTAGQTPTFFLPFATPKGGTPTMTKNGTWGTVNCGQPVADQPSPFGFRFYWVQTATGVGGPFTNSTDDSITAEWNS